MPDILDIFIAGASYRLVNPGYYPGTKGYIPGHPEYRGPDWQVEDIQGLDPDQDRDDAWAPLDPGEWERLTKEHGDEIMEKIRVWARAGEVRET